MIKICERVARLEARQDAFEGTQHQIIAKLEILHTDIAGYKGAWGVILMIGSAIAVAVSMGGDRITSAVSAFFRGAA